MREIKFRCWYEGKIYEVFSYNISDKSVDISLPRFPFSQHVYPDNIMQYTGLKDKNGKEIYEGDILKQTAEHFDSFDDENNIDRTYVGEVVSIPSRGCCLKRPCFTDNLRDKKEKANYYVSAVQYRSEIIGNIYENPELINNP